MSEDSSISLKGMAHALRYQILSTAYEGGASSYWLRVQNYGRFLEQIGLLRKVQIMQEAGEQVAGFTAATQAESAYVRDLLLKMSHETHVLYDPKGQTEEAEARTVRNAYAFFYERRKEEIEAAFNEYRIRTEPEYSKGLGLKPKETETL